MDVIMKIDQTIKDSNILLKGVTETIKNEIKEQKGGFLGMLLGTILLGNMLEGKGMLRAGMEIKYFFNTTSSFNKLWNTDIFSNWT